MSIHDMFSVINKKIDFGKVGKCSHQTILTFVLGARKNRLTEAIVLSIHHKYES